LVGSSDTALHHYNRRVVVVVLFSAITAMADNGANDSDEPVVNDAGPPHAAAAAAAAIQSHCVVLSGLSANVAAVGTHQQVTSIEATGDVIADNMQPHSLHGDTDQVVRCPIGVLVMVDAMVATLISNGPRPPCCWCG
jgi:hypothetical protein